MFRRDKWWNREIEKLRRDHAAREAELIATICRLAGKPNAAPGTHEDPVAPVDDDPTDLVNVDQLP